MHRPTSAVQLHRPGCRRIALFMFDLEPSGVVRNAIRLANAFAGRGHDVHLLVCRDGQTRTGSLHTGVQIVVVPGEGGRSSSRGLALLQAIPELRKILRELRSDVLVSAGNHGHVAALLAALGIPGLRRVVRISNEPDHPGDGHLLRFARTLLLRWIARVAHRLLLVSPRLARHPALADAVRDGRARVAPNGVAADEVQRLAREGCDHAWCAGDPLVVTVGRLVRQKNLEVLIRAVAAANEQRPMRLLIVGNGKPGARASLVALADDMGIADRVDLVGEKTNPFPFMQAASVFVLPSLWEGRSNVLLEAMACNVPIIASRTAGDAQELLGYGRFGLLVDPLDEKGLTDALLWQTGPAPCLPGSRAADFDQEAAVARACDAVLEDIEPAWAQPFGPAPARARHRDARSHALYPLGLPRGEAYGAGMQHGLHDHASRAALRPQP